MTRDEYADIMSGIAMYSTWIANRVDGLYYEYRRGGRIESVRDKAWRLAQHVAIPEWISRSVSPYSYEDVFGPSSRIQWYCVPPDASPRDRGFQCFVDGGASIRSGWPSIVWASQEMSIPRDDPQHPCIRFEADPEWGDLPLDQAAAKFRDRFVETAKEQLPDVLALLEML